MTSKPPDALDRLWDAVPAGAAPVADLVARGRARRRMRKLAGGVTCAAVVAAAAATGFVTRPDHDETSVVTPPDGTRYVGIGRVVVAVPGQWHDYGASCSNPIRDTVYFPWPQDCVGPFRSVSSLAISAEPMDDGFTGPMTADGRIGRYVVVARPSQATCMVGSGPEACLQSFGVPELHAYFTVRIPRDEEGAHDEVEAIRDSLTLLPEGQSTVPFVKPGSPLAAWRTAVEDAGFVAKVDEQTCPPLASCGTGVAQTDPAPGTVLPTGSTVTIVDVVLH